MAAVEASIDLAHNDSSRGIYLARSNKLPAAQQRYLADMAQLSTIDLVGAPEGRSRARSARCV